MKPNKEVKNDQVNLQQDSFLFLAHQEQVENAVLLVLEVKR